MLDTKKNMAVSTPVMALENSSHVEFDKQPENKRTEQAVLHTHTIQYIQSFLSDNTLSKRKPLSSHIGEILMQLHIC